VALSARKVSVAAVERRDFARSFRSTGSLMPKDRARLHALVDGPLEGVLVEIGDRVKAGQVLFQTRSIEKRLAQQTAEAALSAASANLENLKAWKRPEEVAVLRAQLDQAQAELERLQAERERVRNMYKTETVSQSDWDTARTGADAAQARVRVAQEQLRIAEAGPTEEEVHMAEAQVAQAQAAVAEAEQTVEDTEVRAPFDGTITGKFHNPGDYAGKGDQVLEITDPSVLHAEMYLPERFSQVVQTGLAVEIEVESTRLRREGKVIATNQSVDLKTRTFLVKVEVDNSDWSIKAGTFCSGVFRLSAIQGVLAVPVEALHEEEGRTYVWVADQGKARRAFIRTGENDDRFVEICEGVQDVEKVVVAGAGILAEGDALEVSPVETNAPAPNP